MSFCFPFGVQCEGEAGSDFWFRGGGGGGSGGGGGEEQLRERWQWRRRRQARCAHLEEPGAAPALASHQALARAMAFAAGRAASSRHGPRLRPPPPVGRRGCLCRHPPLFTSPELLPTQSRAVAHPGKGREICAAGLAVAVAAAGKGGGPQCEGVARA